MLEVVGGAWKSGPVAIARSWDEVHLLLGATLCEPTEPERAPSRDASRSRLAIVVVLLIGGLAVVLAGVASLDDPMEEALREREAREQRARPLDQSRQQQELREQLAAAKARDRKVEVTDEMVLDAIRQSDDFEQNRAALLRASRAFMQQGGTLGDLREMGGWVRSTSHRGRRVVFTYKRPGTHVRDRYYFDLNSGRLFQ